jgi:hypothetical protein
MPRPAGRPKSLDDSFDNLPKYIASAMAVDRSWSKDARCRTAQRDVRGPWVVGANEIVRVGRSTYKGSELIELALMVCAACPVQYDCIRFALDTDSKWGTWSCTEKDQAWLKKHDKQRLVVARAEYDGVPVQVAVKEAREASDGRRRRRRDLVAV